MCTVVDIVSAASSMTFATGDIVNEWIATLNQDARQIESEAIAKYADSGVTIDTHVLEGYPSSALLEEDKRRPHRYGEPWSHRTQENVAW